VFSDPQSITYAGAAKSLPAISRNGTTSVYQLNDNGVNYVLTLSHQFAKRNRVVARLQRASYSSDPLVPANSVLASMSATMTIDFPLTGLVVADAAALGKALTDFLSTSTNMTRLAGGET